MYIKMLKDDKGSNDGCTVQEFEEGETYEVSEDLGKMFIASKSAEEAQKPRKAEAKAEAKTTAKVTLPGA